MYGEWTYNFRLHIIERAVEVISSRFEPGVDGGAGRRLAAFGALLDALGRLDDLVTALSVSGR